MRMYDDPFTNLYVRANAIKSLGIKVTEEVKGRTTFEMSIGNGDDKVSHRLTVADKIDKPILNEVLKVCKEALVDAYLGRFIDPDDFRMVMFHMLSDATEKIKEAQV